MNLGETRNAIFSQADWSPTQSTDAITRVNQFINRAYFQLTEEAPFLFFEKKVGFATLEDKTPDTDAIRDATGNPAFPADTIDVQNNDPWVFQRTLNNAVAGIGLWDTSGRWNGRMVVISDASGAIRARRRIRDVWNFDVGGGVIHQRISLYQPWVNLTDTLMDWRIYTDDYYLPDEVIEVSSMRLFKNNQNWPIKILGQMEAEQYSLADSPSQVGRGVPRSAFRRFHQQIESPTSPPVHSAGAQNTWLGPEPAGKFEYCFTYAWGYRDAHFRDFGPSLSYAAAQSTPSRLEAMWESSPSPVLTATTSNRAEDPVVYNGASIILTTPDIDYMQGFGMNITAADPRYHHSGWRKRIYRRRHTVDNVNYGALTSQLNGALEQETPDTFFLLDDIPGHQRLYVDTGRILPDYHRRLRDVHGYQSVRFYPRPNDRYEVDVRCILRPKELRDDSDVPELHPDGMNVLLYRALAYLYESQGNLDLADRALSRYSELLFTLTKRYGDLRYPGETLNKRPARAGRAIDSRRPWRRWYNLPNT